MSVFSVTSAVSVHRQVWQKQRASHWFYSKCFCTERQRQRIRFRKIGLEHKAGTTVIKSLVKDSCCWGSRRAEKRHLKETGSGRCPYTSSLCLKLNEALSQNAEITNRCLTASKGYILKVWRTFRAKCTEGDLYRSKQTDRTEEERGSGPAFQDRQKRPNFQSDITYLHHECKQKTVTVRQLDSCGLSKSDSFI